MLHEKPILVALAVSVRSSPKPPNGRRTVSPASAASTSSADSAIGTSPSSAASVSPSADVSTSSLLRIAFSIQPDDGETAEIIVMDIADMEADIADLSDRIGAEALLIATTDDIRQTLHPVAAIQSTRHCGVGETMDSQLRHRLPQQFAQFVSVDTLPDAQLNAEQFAQLSVAERCRAIMDVINEKSLDLLNHVETVNEGYTPYVNFDRRVDSSLVVRTRGLPWQASDQDIALFFAGLNIAPGGIALCLGNEGRRNGESLVCFECNEHRELALRRHRKFLHNRYIEVYRSTGEEFLQVAVGSDLEALRFVCRDAAMIVRMRGLPFDCTESDIRGFFGSDGDPGLMEEGVMFVNRPDGRPTGDAFVLFVDDESGRRALAKHKNRIGSRYIELFRTTQAEVQQIVNRLQQQRVSTPIVAYQNSQPTATPLSAQTPVMPQFHHSASVAPKRDCIRMRGLPYEAKPEQIAEFLGIHAKQIVDQGIHMIFNNQGSPSGEAFIQMRNENAANIAAISLHNKNMELGKKKRYIEVFQCSSEELTGVLNPSPLTQIPHPHQHVGIPPPFAPVVPLSGLLPHAAAALSLQPQMIAHYRNLCAAMGHPGAALPFPNPAIGLSGVPTSSPLLGAHNFAGIPPVFASDQLYTAATHLQQQQMNSLYDPNVQHYPGFIGGAMPPLDIASAATFFHQQQLLMPSVGGAPLKADPFHPLHSLVDLKNKLESVHGTSAHC